LAAPDLSEIISKNFPNGYVDWAPDARHPVVLPVDDVELFQLVLGHLRGLLVGDILLERLDVDDHDLNLVAGRKLPHLAEPFRVVDEVVERNILVERLCSRTCIFFG
jgi:hypothetical protein